MSQNLHHFKGGGIGIRVLVLSFLLITLASLSYGQQRKSISGTVKSASDGLPVIGASVKVKGTTRGTSTNVNGQYTISASSKETLVLTAIGYKTKEVLVGAQTVVNVQLVEDAVQLNEAVVTALGIKREEKSLGYSVTTVKGEGLTEAMSNNWADALTGKVAGLNIVKSGGGPAGSNKIILRGENSITGNSEALIVVDGVIISGSSGRQTGQGQGSGNYLDADAPVDFGSSLSDINPEDIESVSVLKGPGASALYGYRGANGAIIITTKQGASKQKGLGISFSSNTAFASINRWPDYQYEYGQGDRASNGDLYYSYGDSEDGTRTYSTSSAWGPKFNGQLYYQYDPERYRLTAIPSGSAERTPWVAYPDNRKDFFDVSKTFTNSITVSGGTERTSARLSYTNVTNTWIVPNTGYNRNTLALQLNHKLSDKLSISSKVNYNNRWSDNLPSTGYNNQTIMYFIRGLTPNMDINWFKDYWLPGQEGITQRRPFSLQLDNPYLQAYEMLNKSNRNGIIGNVSATYNFNKQLSLMVRTAVDFMAENRSQQRPKNTQKYADGMYREQDIISHEINSDFLLKYEGEKIADFGYGLSFGGSLMHNKYRRDEYRNEKLLFPGIYNLTNRKLTLEPRFRREEYAVNSLYAFAPFSYKNFLFLDLTGRIDWASTLVNPLFPEDVRSFFYPSANLSVVLSDALKLPSQISFLKLRASWAEVGSGGVDAYKTFYNYTSDVYFPSAMANPTVIPEDDLQPLRTRSIELGADIRLFKSRVGFDVSVYKNNTYNQIITAPIDPSSGYSGLVMNAGNVQNTGLEIQVNGTPLKSKNGLNWKVFGNFSSNRNKVVSIPDDKQVLTTIFGSRGTVEARTGGGLGDMYGLGYVRSPEGKIVYDNGLPLLGDSLIYLGNYVPKWKLSMGNQFNYKQFGFNFLFDGQIGGKAYSLTHAVLAEEGKLKETLPGRYNGIIGDGVIKNADGTYRPNDVVATNIGNYYFAHYQRDNLESNMFRTDYIKLREVRLDYNLPTKLVQRLKLQKATIGAYGRDLFVISNWPAFDPEFGTLSDGEITQGSEIAQFPSTRTFGINLNLTL
ncbi:SusC/RagA family TonB-linked outer membrane protein [Arcticibacter tournemirensis]|uniref:SusC/RagA family TonB-linked outer membrane protein n=1 Tax=Arcticibacter tournemirensis TaxID=699437 RepID=A0A4Q0M9E0_9SPHI|nr:SusC/RagA family TonB-linked outer membrane protein [Arcticibacter tournemirensis]RXF69818.1 SusC/RagA family TonB-linked outer membrane protein [Arcticibacter tournemirensis]